ncbi:MAG: heme-binding protein [Hyphomicrobiales bacterium]|nr:heme-binding protein [Hyphomicrobiales bacterium]
MTCPALRHWEVSTATTGFNTRLGNTRNRAYIPDMKKIGKVMMIGLGILGGAAILGIGVWFYVVSNVEQPKYALVTQDGAIELRDYPALVVAEVTRRGDRNAAVRAGFSPLAGYIFAKNRGGDSVSMTAPVLQERQAIAMTAPVTQTPSGDGQSATDASWAIRFVMPAKYTLETLPKAAGDDVRLLQVPPQRRAAIRFSGVATDAVIAANEATLRAWLASRNITMLGLPTYAYYNDPFTPGPLRRNEVMFDVKGL